MLECDPFNIEEKGRTRVCNLIAGRHIDAVVVFLLIILMNVFIYISKE